MPKFNCSFRITTTVEKTWIVTNYEVDLSDEDCRNHAGVVDPETIKDSISDEIYEALDEGYDPEVEGVLVETDYGRSSPDFIGNPAKVDPKSGS